MSKGLEAIKIIDDTFRYGHTDDEGYEVPPYKMCDVCDEEFETAEKELKSLYLIKEKGVDVGFLKTCKDVKEYNYYCYGEETNKKLTEEEFNFVMEMLEND